MLIFHTVQLCYSILTKVFNILSAIIICYSCNPVYMKSAVMDKFVKVVGL